VYKTVVVRDNIFQVNTKLATVISGVKDSMEGEEIEDLLIEILNTISDASDCSDLVIKDPKTSNVVVISLS